MDYCENLRKLQERIQQDWSSKGNLEWAIMGIASEGGELLDCLIKEKFYNKNRDLQLKEELSDVFHYLLAICMFKGWSLDELAKVNFDKTSLRYPNGWDPNLR